MARLSLDDPWAFAFGLLGNLILVVVYLSPIITFYRIYQKKSTERFQYIPYLVSLFSATLWIYYAIVKTNEYLLITINSFGCLAEITYMAIFLAYTPRETKVHIGKVFLMLNVGLFCFVILSTLLLTKGAKRQIFLGWICVGFAVNVFAAPLSIMRQVIRTKSVEYMSFYESFFLTLSALAWFLYGLLTKDIYVMIPNILGFSFGVVQIVMYIMYKGSEEEITEGEANGTEINIEANEGVEMN